MDEEEVENFVENFVEKNRIDSSDVKISKRNARLRHQIHLRRLKYAQVKRYRIRLQKIGLRL